MERKKREKEEQVTYKLEQAIALWDPQTAAESTTDPFRTLFVARINFYTSESKLRREFETYGPIKQIKMITDQKTGKPRGYCFIEFEHEKDMHCKYLYIVICSPQEKLPSGCSVPNRGIPIKLYSSSLFSSVISALKILINCSQFTMYKQMKRIFNTQITDRNNFREFLKAQKEILKVFF